MSETQNYKFKKIEKTDKILNSIDDINSNMDGVDNALNDLQSQISSLSIISIVDALPATGSPNKIYFVPKTSTQDKDLFDEYMWINDKWEWITTKQIETDMTNFYNKIETNNLLANKVDNTAFETYKTEINNALAGKADASHTQSANTITAGLFPGNVVGQNLAVTINGMRNIKAGTDDLVAGESTLATGNIYLVYE